MKKMLSVLIVLIIMFISFSVEAQNKGKTKNKITNNINCNESTAWIKPKMMYDFFYDMKSESGSKLLGVENTSLAWLNNPNSQFYYKNEGATVKIVTYAISIVVREYINDKLKCRLSNSEKNNLINARNMYDMMFAGRLEEINDLRSADQNNIEQFEKSKMCFTKYDLPESLKLVKQHPEWPKCR